jgi:lambda repressor-like predicted transcriptional regulator
VRLVPSMGRLWTMSESTWQQAIKAAIGAKGLTMKSASKRAGLGETFVRDMLARGRRPSIENFVKLCEAIGLDPGPLLPAFAPDAHAFAAEESSTVPIGGVGHLRVLYRVAAGSWVETDETSQELEEYAPISPRPDIPLTDQWAEIVVGDSFNLHYPEGTILHVRGGWAFDPRAPRARPPRVIVARKRAGGLLVERTIKEAVVNAAGEVELWPRSTNPRWSKPIHLEGGLRPGEDMVVEIVGLVIGAYLPA